MARRTARERLPELVDAAVRVFWRKGYRGAQMADIAREMGVSEAALYRYVQSKEGLFRLALLNPFIDDELPSGPLPLSSPPLEVTLKEISDRASTGTPPRLEEALGRRRVDDPAVELEGIVRELFELTVQTRQVADILERSAEEMPELAELMNEHLRPPLLGALTTYLERRARRGHLRTTPDARATARVLLETVTWFGRHRLSDPEGAAMTDDAAEETVVDMLVHALRPVREETSR